MISVTQLKNGATFKMDGQPFVVTKYEHTKMGRGNATIKVKVRNLQNGAIVEKTFVSGTRVEDIQTEKKKMQYLYQDGEDYAFMDPVSFEQVSVSSQAIGESGQFLQEGAQIDVMFWEGKGLAVDLPPALTFTVAKTGPGVKGNSATNIWKEAVLENEAKVKVPLFVKEGERIRVDTRTGEYVERAK